MKHLVKLFSLGAALALAPLAHATPISGSIGFGGNGSYSNITNLFVAGSTIVGTTGNAYVNVPGTGSLTGFTQFNAANFFNFNSNVIPSGGELVFSTTETIGSTATLLTFTLTGFTADGSNPAGPGFSGTGILSETGYTNTSANFTLNTNALAGTFVTFNTAAVAATPEPSSLVLLGSGLVSAAGMLLRRRRTV